MTVRNLFVVDALLGISLGASLLGVPVLVLLPFGIEADQVRVFLARMFGASLIGHGLLLWLTRAANAVTVRSIVRAHLCFDVIAGVVSAMATLSGLVNAFGWTVAGLFAVLAVLRFYFGVIQRLPNAA